MWPDAAQFDCIRFLKTTKQKYYETFNLYTYPSITNINCKRVLTDNLIVLGYHIGLYEGLAKSQGKRVHTQVRAAKDLWFTYLGGVAMNICTDFAGNAAICKEHRDGIIGVNQLVESEIESVKKRILNLQKVKKN